MESQLATLGQFKQKEISELPNDVLLIILKFCSGTDIVGFSEAYPTKRIKMVAGDKSLWKNATIGPQNLQKCLVFLGEHTKKLTLLGIRVKVRSKNDMTRTVCPQSDLLQKSVLKNIQRRCKSLTHLTLQNVALDTQEVKFSLFPKSLEALSLNNVYLLNFPFDHFCFPSFISNGEPLSGSISPFHNLKRNLPELKMMHLQNHCYDQQDVEAIMVGISLKIPNVVRRSDCVKFTFDGEGELPIEDEDFFTASNFVYLKTSEDTDTWQKVLKIRGEKYCQYEDTVCDVCAKSCAKLNVHKIEKGAVKKRRKAGPASRVKKEESSDSEEDKWSPGFFRQSTGFMRKARLHNPYDH